ncbi:hypothetical protein [Rudaea sp.]|uniref:DUF4139 domain-containing protein n=1 Tax=Rudaea sp. TaxID=2136325 RepID=UPI00321FC471
MRRTTLAVSLIAGVAATADAQAPASRYALSIYSAQANNGDGLFETAADAGSADSVGGYAVVRDRRQFNFNPGNNAVEVREVARWLDASALSARFVEPGDATIVSQRFDDQTLSFDALVQRQIGHPVEIAGNGANPAAAPISGTLLSNNGGLTVQLADGRVTTVTDYSRVTFPDLPKGMSATPALRLDVNSRQGGPRSIEFVYPTQGLAWRAEYSGWIAAGGDCKLTLSGWALIANRSGASYRGAQIKLIAGSPNRVAQQNAPRPMTMAKAAGATAPVAAADSGALGDYHEYTIDAPLDLIDNSLQRVALFPDTPLACQRQYLFEATHLRANPGMAPITERGYGASGTQPVRSALAFRIDRALPAGRVRMLQAANDGAPEFVGEDQIGHTPKNEPVALQLGDAFDLRGERRQTDFTLDKNQHSLGETFALRVSNAGDAARSVVVREHLYRWTQWNITQASVKYEKKNSDTVEFKLDVPANGEATATYTVQYQWTESFK